MTARDDAIDDAEDTIEDYQEAAESWIEQKIVDVRDAARDEPIKMLAIAAGIGAVIGAFFLR